MGFLARVAPKTWKGRAIGGVSALLLLLGAWQGVRAWWLRGYSTGQRTGYLRKLSRKGPPGCKYWSGELAPLAPNRIGGANEIWEFTIDDGAEDAPLARELAKVETEAKPLTLTYRQDLGKWWACAPTEYYVTGLAK